jgi:hypothetical protein
MNYEKLNSNENLYQPLSTNWMERKILQAVAALRRSTPSVNLDLTASLTTEQERLLASMAMRCHNGGCGRNTSYAPVVLPIWERVYCV